MVSQKSIEKLEHSVRKLSVTIPKEYFQEEYKKMLQKYAKQIKIDGFRVGKVPLSVIESKYGKELELEAANQILGEAMDEVFKDSKEDIPLPYTKFDLDGELKPSLDTDLTFSVKYDAYPEVPLIDYKDLAIEINEVEISKEDEEKELKELQNRNALVVDKAEGSKAEKGDVITVNYCELGDADEKLADAAREDFTFEIGTGYNIYHFDDDFIGMKKGEEKKITKTYPQDSDDKYLAGRTIKLELKLTNLKQKKLPELDDDFAQDVSEKFKTIADLRTDIRTKLEKNLEERLTARRNNKLIEELRKRINIDLPQSMIEAEVNARFENLKSRLGIDSDSKLTSYLAMMQQTPESLTREWHESAQKDLQVRLTLNRLIEAGKYECNDADIEKAYEGMATRMDTSIEVVKEEYAKHGGLDYLKEGIREEKLMNDMFASAKVTKAKKLSYNEFLNLKD